MSHLHSNSTKAAPATDVVALADDVSCMFFKTTLSLINNAVEVSNHFLCCGKTNMWKYPTCSKLSWQDGGRPI